MTGLRRVLLILGVLPKLGLGNTLYIAYYRLSLKSGFRKKRFPAGKGITGDFFVKEPVKNRHSKEDFDETAILRNAEDILAGIFTFYHFHKFDLGATPNWFYDPFSRLALQPAITKKHWTEIKEFDLNTGDIKNLWEVSRFDWVTDLSMGYVISGEEKYLNRLNDLLNNWSRYNPPNRGVNWHCGQETSIRVMKLLNASVVMDNAEKLTPALSEFVYSHLRRINGNIHYAIAQDNNHGTSEAGTLYIGAAWLLRQNNKIREESLKELTKFKDKGRKLLENRVKKLILQDGTFAQKSLNYHRVVVDTLSFVLYGMKKFDEPPFSPEVEKRLEELGEWLLQMISNEKGEVPNIGANDGALFETLHNCSYRDFRPSLQLFFALLKQVRIWEDKSVNEPLAWRGLTSGLNRSEAGTLTSCIRDKEFVQMVYKDIIVRVKATQDNFRPSNDVLHVDVWYHGQNVLMDAGSYSYNSDLSDYFNSSRAHNTMQFGNDEPMPKISRFLNGKWVKVESDKNVVEEKDKISWAGEYKDYNGNRHKRSVILKKEELVLEIIDQYASKVDGVLKKLRFHMPADAGALISLSCKDGNGRELVPTHEAGLHSLYYMNKNGHDTVLFENTDKEGSFITRIVFKS